MLLSGSHKSDCLRLQTFLFPIVDEFNKYLLRGSIIQGRFRMNGTKNDGAINGWQSSVLSNHTNVLTRTGKKTKKRKRERERERERKGRANKEHEEREVKERWWYKGGIERRNTGDARKSLANLQAGGRGRRGGWAGLGCYHGNHTRLTKGTDRVKSEIE